MIRALFLTNFRHKGVSSVARAYKTALERFCGWKVDLCYFREESPPTDDGYDYIHYWSLEIGSESLPVFWGVPTGLTVHGYSNPDGLRYCVEKASAADTALVHALDPWTAMSLGDRGVFAFWTPQLADFADLTPAQPPPNPVTLGYIGNHRRRKRFDCLDAIAEGAGIPPLAVESTDDSWLTPAEVDQFYSRLGVCGVAHLYPACGPLPLQEALYCGRPVLTVPCPTALELVRPGHTGEFFDGSLADGARSLKRLLARYDDYAACVRETYTPSYWETRACCAADQFDERVRERVL